MPNLPAQDIRAYYAAALAALRFVETRRPTGRRFGAEADARWSGFRGDLTTADRLDLLLRDADAEWPGAFGARAVFAESAVAEDDAFGSGWNALDPVEAEEVWRTGLTGSAAVELDALFSSWGIAWGHSITPTEVGPVTTADRFVAAGPGASAALIRAFVGRADLSFSEQVTIVATSAAHRQLGAFGTAVLNAVKPASILTHVQAKDLVGRVIVSADASPEDAAAARGAAS